jgi:hypothetical protein
MSNVENTISAEIAMLKRIHQRASAMQKLFKDHPAAVGETYFEHMGTAFTFAARLFGASIACFVHGLFPFLFPSTGSTMVKRLYQRMIVARTAHRGTDQRLERTGVAAAVD